MNLGENNIIDCANIIEHIKDISCETIDWLFESSYKTIINGHNVTIIKYDGGKIYKSTKKDIELCKKDIMQIKAIK